MWTVYVQYVRVPVCNCANSLTGDCANLIGDFATMTGDCATHAHVYVALEGSMLAWSCYYVSNDLSCSCVAEIYSQRVFLVNICVTIFCHIFTRMLL